MARGVRGSSNPYDVTFVTLYSHDVTFVTLWAGSDVIFVTFVTFVTLNRKEQNLGDETATKHRP